MKIEIKYLHPTQISVGFEQVNEKYQKIHKLSSSKLTEFLKDHLVPIILGPDKKIYIIDHHHLCFALYNNNNDEVYGNIIKDWSDFEYDEFWQHMMIEKYIWMNDEEGNRITLDEFLNILPKSINKLKDDPYRSLAGIIKNKDGYDKIFTPFAEFRWANFFRKKIIIPKNGTSFTKEIINEALKLASSNEAKELPGFEANKIN